MLFNDCLNTFLSKVIFLYYVVGLTLWESGSPPTGGAGRMKLSCVEPESVIHI